MFTNITENCDISPSGSSPSSAVVDDWHTYNNCWRVRASGPARPREWRWAPVPSTALSRTSRALPPQSVSAFLSVPFCSVLCCLCALLDYPAPPSVRPSTHVCRLWWLTADHCPSWYGTLSTLDTICHAAGLADLSLFAISPDQLCPSEDSCWKTCLVPGVEDIRKYWHWKL